MSLYLKKHKAVFLHVPRTGGNWVRNVLRRIAEMPARNFYGTIPEHIDRKHACLSHKDRRKMARVKYIFAFVRHPVSYYESVWKWLNRDARKRSAKQPNWAIRRRWHPFRDVAKLWDQEFNVWVARVLEDVPAFATRLFEMYVGPEGAPFVDFIGRLENIKEDMEVVLSRLGNPMELDNVTGKINAIDKDVSWDDYLLERVLKIERPTIERFYAPR